MKTLEQLAREAGMDCEGERWFSQSSDPLDSFDVLTADLARFRAACRAEALEEAAKVADEFRAKTLAAQVGDAGDLSNIMLRQLAELGYGQCAAAIREMK